MSTNLVPSYKEQIAHLEAEIETLQTKLDAKSQLSISAASFSKLKAAKENEILESGSSLDSDPVIAKISGELGLSNNLAGVELIDVTGVPLVPGSCNQMHYYVKGSSQGVEFQLNFVITQTETGITVSGLEIDSLEPVNNDLGHLFDKIEQEQWIQGFFIVFVPYAKLRSERRVILSRLKDKFGDLVQLSETSSDSQLEFSHQTWNEIIFRVKWGFSVLLQNSASLQHSASHVIKLHVEAPLEAMANKTIQSAPEMFEKMVESLGPEAAIEALIKSSAQDETHLDD